VSPVNERPDSYVQRCKMTDAFEEQCIYTFPDFFSIVYILNQFYGVSST
jgi:hypothetical protein